MSSIVGVPRQEVLVCYVRGSQVVSQLNPKELLHIPAVVPLMGQHGSNASPQCHSHWKSLKR